MQLTHAQKLITDAYNILSHNEDYTYVSDYMCKEAIIHDDFWPLHKKLCVIKGELRTALNQFSETAEKTIEIIYAIKNLIERDKANKKGKDKRKGRPTEAFLNITQ